MDIYKCDALPAPESLGPDSVSASSNECSSSEPIPCVSTLNEALPVAEVTVFVKADTLPEAAAEVEARGLAVTRASIAPEMNRPVIDVPTAAAADNGIAPVGAAS